MTKSAPAVRYRYRAAGPDGRVTRGTVTAAGLDGARAKLMELRLLPIELEVEGGRGMSRRRLSDADLALGARMLSDLLSSGLPVSRALTALDDLAPKAWRAHLRQLQEEVTAGASLSTALANLGGAVPRLMVGLIRAGEIGGGLAASLDAAAVTYEATASARSALASALAYPTFLLVVCVGSVALLTGVVVPRFAALLADLGQQLPPATTTLLAAADGVRRWGPTAGLSLTIGVLAAWYATMTPRGRCAWHEALLRLPVIGAARHAWASSTVCASASALVQSGVVLPAALHHAAQACNDAAVALRIDAARSDILGGARPSDALARRGALTQTAVRLLRAGEEAGNVPVTLARAAQLERARTMRLVNSAIRMLEPTLVITLGALVAFVATALLQAVYAIRPAP